jgi:ferredoxin
MNDGPFHVRLRGSEEEFEVQPGETILEAAERCNIFLPYSCRSGTCRSCMTQVLSGVVDHDPEYAAELAIDEFEMAAGFRLLCSSFARSDVELDR